MYIYTPGKTFDGSVAENLESFYKINSAFALKVLLSRKLCILPQV